MKIKPQPENPDELDPVFDAYQTIRLVLKNAKLVPNPKHPDEEEMGRALVEENLEILEAWLIEQTPSRLDEEGKRG
jgi:hypothetical protein